MTGRTRVIKKESPLHRKLLTRIASRIRYGEKARSDQEEKWRRAEESTLAYMPTSVDDNIRHSRRRRGQPSYTTIQIPYSYAILMTAHTYLTSVFFGRSPIHQFMGRHGETEMQVQAMEAVIAYQTEVGELLAPYYLWLYDAPKYGLGILGSYWSKETTQYSDLRLMLDPATGREIKVQNTIQIPAYEGHRCCNVSPFDWFGDPRVPVSRFQDGEFCGERKMIGWNEFVRRKELGYYMNEDYLKAGAAVSKNESGSAQLKRPLTPSEDLEDGDVKHPAAFYVYEFFIELIPSEWELGSSKYPEKWVFTVTGDLACIIGAQPLGLMHGKFPYDVLEVEVEAYGLYNRGLPEVIEAIQHTLDWLMNSHMYNVRAALNNQFLIDPSKVVISDVADGGPGFVYRLRPEAYGSDVRSFFHQIQVQDMTQGHVGDMSVLLGLGERVTGINDQMFGMLGAGGSSRKTATEVRTSTGFGVNRLKTMAEYLSATGFTKHGGKLVQTTQQYYTAQQKYKIAGQLALDAGAGFMDVRPEDIAGGFSLVPVDGTMPIDRMAQASLWQQMLSQLYKVPQIAQQYDFGRIFGYVANLAGMRNLQQFKLQPMDPMALAAQAQAGNVIPINGPRPGSPSAGVPTAGPPPADTSMGFEDAEDEYSA